ncbi:hypothetical protein PIB30_048889 [Stylosanthes scabra]|uniref:PB1-like domain-containing protein n=1 Tax=Stylosanthes scabra TaxID=79078 RepID=A0ABU6RHR9_9FABA|nr:hypothetical protein [Stylosanthes scabra]
MDEVMVVPVFHVGGWMVRNKDGALVYEGGNVEKLERIAIEVLSFSDLVNMLGGLGYKTHRAMHWYDFAEDVFELGLFRIFGDAEVFDLRSHVMSNFDLVDEFHIYVEHEVNVPLLATAPGDTHAEPIEVDEEGGSSSSSSDNGGYETIEDEPYKPLAVGVDDDTDSEDGGGSQVKSRKKGKSAKSIAGQKGKGVLNRGKEPRREGVEKVPKNCGGPKVGLKDGPSKKEEDGPSKNEEQPNVGPSKKNGCKFYQPQISSSDEEYNYEYESETLHTPVSSDEEYHKHALQEMRLLPADSGGTLPAELEWELPVNLRLRV